MKALFASGLLCLWSLVAIADPIKIATYNTELSQKGPGLLLRALDSGRDPKVEAALATIIEANADILVLQGIDWDLEHKTLTALSARLADLEYKFTFSREPNRGQTTLLDMNGDGRKFTAADAQGYGAFRGAQGMVVLSRYPLLSETLIDLSNMLWRDLPGADLPEYEDGTAFPSVEAQYIQRLSSTNHWILPVQVSEQETLNLMIFHASPPVFDGPEDQNGKRNRDELRLWQYALDRSDILPNDQRVILIGDANSDPDKGAGHKDAITALLTHPRLQDPTPQGEAYGSATVLWPQTGPMRVDYILPDHRLSAVASGVLFPKDQDHPAHRASRHYLVWVEIAFP